MKLMCILITAGAVTLAGCSHFATTQSDTSYEKGLPVRTVTTTAKATTFFDAGSQLAQFKATQTDKTQSAAVGSLNQQSNGSNTVDLVSRTVGAAVSAAVGAAKP